MKAQCIGILGGSFNPVHVGHVRLAIEVYEALFPQLDYIDLVPCAQPPHKDSATFLPFELRAALVQAAIAEISYLRVNPLEAQRLGPSYTYDTLCAYKEQAPSTSCMFLLGNEDFANIDQWYKGDALPRLAHLVVVPRAGADSSCFCQTISTLWPTASIEKRPQGGYVAHTEWDTQILYLPLPRLDVSASLLRQKWIEGKNIQHLLPKASLYALQQHKQLAMDAWSNRAQNTSLPFDL